MSAGRPLDRRRDMRSTADVVARCELGEKFAWSREDGLLHVGVTVDRVVRFVFALFLLRRHGVLRLRFRWDRLDYRFWSKLSGSRTRCRRTRCWCWVGLLYAREECRVC